MRTVYTAPNGNADVVTQTPGGFFRVRERGADGTWRLTNIRYTATYVARGIADALDEAIARRHVAL